MFDVISISEESIILILVTICISVSMLSFAFIHNALKRITERFHADLTMIRTEIANFESIVEGYSKNNSETILCRIKELDAYSKSRHSRTIREIDHLTTRVNEINIKNSSTEKDQIDGMIQKANNGYSEKLLKMPLSEFLDDYFDLYSDNKRIKNSLDWFRRTKGCKTLGEITPLMFGEKRNNGGKTVEEYKYILKNIKKGLIEA